MARKKLATVVELRRELSPGTLRWRRAVMRAHKLGLRQCDIAARLGIDEKTLRNRWKGRGVKVLDDVEALEAMAEQKRRAA